MVQFLKHLLRHLHGKLLVIWDGLPTHRDRLVRSFVAAQQGRLELEFLSAYTPQLNPVESLVPPLGGADVLMGLSASPRRRGGAQSSSGATVLE